jgi:hypothetical protein
MHAVHLPNSCTLAWEALMSGTHGGVEKPLSRTAMREGGQARMSKRSIHEKR